MSRRLVLLALIVALAGIAAHLTRPGRADLEAMIDKAVREKVANTDLDTSGEPVATLALAACKLRPSDCAALVREAVKVKVEKGLFTSRARVEGLGREASCLGVFGRFFCRDTEQE